MPVGRRADPQTGRNRPGDLRSGAPSCAMANPADIDPSGSRRVPANASADSAIGSFALPAARVLAALALLVGSLLAVRCPRATTRIFLRLFAGAGPDRLRFAARLDVLGDPVHRAKPAGGLPIVAIAPGPPLLLRQRAGADHRVRHRAAGVTGANTAAAVRPRDAGIRDWRRLHPAAVRRGVLSVRIFRGAAAVHPELSRLLGGLRDAAGVRRLQR